MKKLIFPLFILALTGCDSEHSVDWYKEHNSEREAKITECRNDAAERAKPDCQNAIQAEQDLKVLGKKKSSDDGLSLPKVTP